MVYTCIYYIHLEPGGVQLHFQQIFGGSWSFFSDRGPMGGHDPWLYVGVSKNRGGSPKMEDL